MMITYITFFSFLRITKWFLFIVLKIYSLDMRLRTSIAYKGHFQLHYYYIFMITCITKTSISILLANDSLVVEGRFHEVTLWICSSMKPLLSQAFIVLCNWISLQFIWSITCLWPQLLYPLQDLALYCSPLQCLPCLLRPSFLLILMVVSCSYRWSTQLAEVSLTLFQLHLGPENQSRINSLFVIKSWKYV